MLKFENVNYSYNINPLLSNISFIVQQGEFVFMIGKSGSGKSTILKLVNLIEKPTSGEIEFDIYKYKDVRTREIPKIRRKIGMIFQDFKFLSDRNIFDNLSYILEITGTKSGKVKKKVMEILTEVGIAHRQKAMIDELSGGELQRAAIARAMLNQPKLLICDEPTGNLDNETSEEIMQLIYKINQKGTTILFATHNLSLITNSSRVIELKNGTIQEKLDTNFD